MCGCKNYCWIDTRGSQFKTLEAEVKIEMKKCCYKCGQVFICSLILEPICLEHKDSLHVMINEAAEQLLQFKCNRCKKPTKQISFYTTHERV
jgi:hypothetical protein